LLASEALPASTEVLRPAKNAGFRMTVWSKIEPVLVCNEKLVNRQKLQDRA